MELRTGPGGNRDEIALRLRESLIEVATTEHQLRTEIERVQAELARLPAEPETPAPEASPPRAAPPVAGPPEPGRPATGQPEAEVAPTSHAAPAPTEGNEAAKATEGLPAPSPAAPEAASATDPAAVSPANGDESALVSGLPRPPAKADHRARLATRLAELQTQLGDVQTAKESIATQLRNLPATLATAEADANVFAVRQLLAAAGIDDLDRESLEPLAELSKLSVDEELAALRREMGLEPPTAPSGPQPSGPPAEPKTPESKDLVE